MKFLLIILKYELTQLYYKLIRLKSDLQSYWMMKKYQWNNAFAVNEIMKKGNNGNYYVNPDGELDFEEWLKQRTEYKKITKNTKDKVKEKIREYRNNNFNGNSLKNLDNELK